MSANGERGPDEGSALTRLVGMPTAEFEREFWGEKPLLTHTSGFEDLFSADAADDLVADHGLRTPFARMAQEGTVLAASGFTASGGFGAEIADQLDSTKVLARFAAGATLVLQGLHRTWQPISAFTRALVGELGHPAQVNAYITPASSRGFDPHYDTHDVFVLQIAGSKHWTIHDPVHRHPLGDQPWTHHRDAVAARAGEPPVIDAVFEPGDVLYLPRGWIHSAVAGGGTSIHLTIGVKALTRHDLLRDLLADAANNAELRAPLPLGAGLGAADLSSDVVALVAGAQRALPRLDADAAVAAARVLFDAAVRPEPVRPLRTAELIADLPGDAMVGWRSALAARIEHDASAVRIVMPAATITLPAEAAAAIGALRAADHPAGSLPGLDAESSLVVARRLLREGVIVPR